MEITAPPLSKAEENCLRIAGLVKKMHYDFLELGGLLLENRTQGYWGASGAESYKVFIQQLGLSYDWATRLVDIVENLVGKFLTKDEVVKIGVAKACLLLPCAKQGKLSEDIKLLAEHSTWNDLREALGHHLVEPKDDDLYMLCPRCGSEISPINVRCNCGEQISIKLGMVKRR